MSCCGHVACKYDMVSRSFTLRKFIKDLVCRQIENGKEDVEGFCLLRYTIFLSSFLVQHFFSHDTNLWVEYLFLFNRDLFIIEDNTSALPVGVALVGFPCKAMQIHPQ